MWRGQATLRAAISGGQRRTTFRQGSVQPTRREKMATWMPRAVGEGRGWLLRLDSNQQPSG